MRRIAALALLAAAVCAAPARGDDALTGRLVVSLHPAPGGARAAAPAVLAGAGARRSGPSVPQIGAVAVRPAGGASLRATARRLRRDPRVRAVSAERRARPRLVPDDPALREPETAPGAPPGTVVQWWAARTGLFEAWDVVARAGATVAVVDSGVDGEHPELGPQVRRGLDTDATAGEGGPLFDDAGHGSHVASLACAATGNGVGIAGAGLGCGLVVAKTDFADASVAQAIVLAADSGASVTTLAFGTDGDRPAPQALLDAVRYAAARDVVLVAAAADADTEEQGDPANLLQPTGTGPDLDAGLGLSVTAATGADRRAGFAGRGTQISLAAYGAVERGAGGRGLLGAWPANPTTFERSSTSAGGQSEPPCRCRRPFRGDARYAELQGTSMATAITAGVASLVRRLNPDLRAPEVVRLLKASARRPGAAGWTPDLGWGILDARAAVEAARTLDRRPPSSSLRASRRARRSAVTVRLAARDTAPEGVVASGVDHVEVWRSVRGREPRRVAIARGRTARVRIGRGAPQRLFSVAVDRAGNREPAPARADATVRAAG